MRFKAVIFDLFGTLLLVEKGMAYYRTALRRLYEFLAKTGISVSFEDFCRIYFEVRDRIYGEVEKNFEEPHFNVRISRVLRLLGYNFDVSNPIVAGGTNVFADEFMRFVCLDDDALDVLLKLRGKYKLGLISNFSIPECFWRLLDKFGLRKFFDVILVSVEMNKRKPSPEIFKKALHDLGIDAAEAVFVGDTLGLDVKGAKDVGIMAVLIERKPIERGVDIKPDAVVRSLRELLVFLEGS